MSFQLASDLHLEFYNIILDYSSFIKPNADYLLLAGDIGYPKNLPGLFDHFSPLFKKIFYISGNHEYYSFNDTSKTMDIIDSELETICNSYPNVYYLNNKVHVIDNIVIIGTTMWSPISPMYRSLVKHNLSDYSVIHIKEKHYTKLVSPDDITDLYVNNLIWLSNVLKEHPDKQIIVMTHHLPSFQLIHDKYKGSHINEAFASNLEYLMHTGIKYWVAGHTHITMSKIINGTNCLTNPAGYPENGAFENALYSPTFVFNM